MGMGRGCASTLPAWALPAAAAQRSKPHSDPTLLPLPVLESLGKSSLLKAFGHARPFTLEIKVFTGDLQSYKSIQTKHLIKRILWLPLIKSFI